MQPRVQGVHAEGSSPVQARLFTRTAQGSAGATAAAAGEADGAAPRGARGAFAFPPGAFRDAVRDSAMMSSRERFRSDVTVSDMASMTDGFSILRVRLKNPTPPQANAVKPGRTPYKCSQSLAAQRCASGMPSGMPTVREPGLLRITLPANISAILKGFLLTDWSDRRPHYSFLIAPWTGHCL